MPAPDTTPKRMSHDSRWLLRLCTAQVFIMLVFINYSAVLPLLKSEWGMNNTMAGSIFSVYQFGYILSGVLLSALTDRINTRYIFLTAALWSGIANLLFALFAHDYLSAMILRALTGIGMGGTYMPGLKLVAERFSPARRGKAVGIYVGALVLGASLSLALTGAVASFVGWRIAFVACSAGVLIGLLIAKKVFDGYVPQIFSGESGGFRTEVVQNRPALLMILGYGCHMWEMYGMRTWVAPFLAASLIAHGTSPDKATGLGAAAAAVIVGVGAFATAITGTLSDQWGRTKTITVVMTASGLLSFSFGWLFDANPLLILVVGIAYGYLVVAESPVFSTGLTELVAPAYLGAAMGMQSLVGYSMGMISPTVFGWALDLFKGWEPFHGIGGEWGIGFATCGLGGLMGPLFMWLLRRRPESAQMAGGRK
ncbi:MFS transporter [Geobacter sp. OR-1]|uniref:MFS transporter n=1 Tax=Geobacter sp. OR-1 TaxID=1266765 RepID=UPI001ED9AF22|nr:MFS transporter [Geobacter sp. OR-1]